MKTLSCMFFLSSCPHFIKFAHILAVQIFSGSKKRASQGLTVSFISTEYLQIFFLNALQLLNNKFFGCFLSPRDFFLNKLERDFDL